MGGDLRQVVQGTRADSDGGLGAFGSKLPGQSVGLGRPGDDGATAAGRYEQESGIEGVGDALSRERPRPGIGNDDPSARRQILSQQGGRRLDALDQVEAKITRRTVLAQHLPQPRHHIVRHGVITYNQSSIQSAKGEVSLVSLITIIGRGHSGTRAISHTLYASGVFMGNTINRSGDKVPPEAMYEAARVFARHVPWKGGLEWDFEALNESPIDPDFERLVGEYLHDVHEARTEHRGWKLPETTLVLPWITRMYPDAYYIYLLRDPRDSILGGHKTDDLASFGVSYPETEDVLERRAISWKYQYDLVAATPKPQRWMTLRFEDFVLHQERELKRLEEFLGIPLGRIIVRPDSVGRWQQTPERVPDFDFLQSALQESGYADPG